jgi:hypothetical protein
MPGDSKHERRLWKIRLALIGVAAVVAGIAYVVRHIRA